MQIFTLGDIKHDTFVALPDASVLCAKKESSCSLCFAYGEKIPVGAFFSQVAGTAPNVAIGLARLGHATGVMSTIGTDPLSADALRFLKEHGVDTRFIRKHASYIPSNAVVITFKGESTQLVAHAPTKHVLPKAIPSQSILHVAEIGADYRALYKHILAHTKKHALYLSMNPGIVQIRERSRELFALLRVCKILFVNLKEAALLTKLPLSSAPELHLAELRKLGPHTVVLTNGTQGAYAASATQAFFAPIFPGVRKEATGAGDAFSAGVLGALLHQKTLKDALAWGSVNAAEVIGFIGPTAGLLPAREITKRLRNASAYRVSALHTTKRAVS